MSLIRIQRMRTKGWRMPEGAIYVGRPTMWGNPFIVGDPSIPDRAAAVQRYRDWWELLPNVQVGQRLWVLNYHMRELRGHDLACWCPTCPEHRDGLPLGVKCEACAPCHADVLLELANAPLPEKADV